MSRPRRQEIASRFLGWPFNPERRNHTETRDLARALRSKLQGRVRISSRTRRIPLTLGNAIIAPVEENNRLFPDCPVTEKKVSISTGLMNMISPLFGGVPMCHGAGGMAGHVRFGARTGGALIILGVVILLTALFLSGSIQTLFQIFPSPVLGVILFLTGSQLALGICDPGDKHDRFAMLTTAAFAVWNIGLAFVVGMAIHFLLKRGIVKL